MLKIYEYCGKCRNKNYLLCVECLRKIIHESDINLKTPSHYIK
jgi:hypothetical protein